MGKKVKRVLIAAAGKGTRLAPITSVLPKEILNIIDKPTLHYVFEENIVPGIEEVILVTNQTKSILLDYLKNGSSTEFQEIMNNIKLTVIYQDGEKYGDAIPIMCAQKYLEDEPFLVAWADSFSLRNYSRIDKLLDTYQKHQKPVISLIPITKYETSIYAVPNIKRTLRKDLIVMDRLLEKPGPGKAPSLLGAPNGFILEADIFPYLHRLKPNKKGEYSLIDGIDFYCQNNPLLGLVSSHPFFEAGNKKDMIKTILKMSFVRDDLKIYMQEIKLLFEELTKS